MISVRTHGTYVILHVREQRKGAEGVQTYA